MPGLIRVTPLLAFLTTGLSETTTSAVVDLNPSTSGQTVYGVLHLVSCSAVGWTFKIQSASSSGMTGVADRFTFTAQVCSAAQWPTPLAFPAAPSEARYWRATATPTATTDTRLGLISVSVQ